MRYVYIFYGAESLRPAYNPREVSIVLPAINLMHFIKVIIALLQKKYNEQMYLMSFKKLLRSVMMYLSEHFIAAYASFILNLCGPHAAAGT